MTFLGERIKKVRKQADLKQSEFAERLLVSASYISKIESGKEIPSDIFIRLISLEFNIPFSWLKNGVDNNTDYICSEKKFREHRSIENMYDDEIIKLIYNITNSFNNENKVLVKDYLASYLSAFSDIASSIRKNGHKNKDFYVYRTIRDIESILDDFIELVTKDGD